MYEPFRYPPDLELAKLHRDCTRPGDENPTGRTCPCCGVREKLPIEKWVRRDIRQDFSQHGGAVVTYFSLLKFYAASVLIVIGLYSVFHAICNSQACEAQRRSDPSSKVCVQPLGFWVVSTQDLTTIMKKHEELAGRVPILLILRGVTFVFLMIVNMVSLYVVSNRRSQRLIKEQPSLRHFTLFFKNIPKSTSVEDLKQELSAIDPDITIKDAFLIRKTDKLKKFYDQKLESYFKLQSQKISESERKKQIKLLEESLKKIRDAEASAAKRTGRAVVTFGSVKNVKLVANHYRLSFLENVRQTLDLRGTDRMYVDPMPKPEEILWQFLGKESHQKVQMKIFTFFVMVGLLVLSYLLLGKALHVGDLDFKDNTLPIVKQAWSTFLALVVVAFAMIFRQIMNFLSELRNPNTQTSKTMFIVCTTVVYHFLYFLIIPTIFFLRAKAEERSLQLHSISYQALNFVIVQLILAGFDVFYCCWASSSTKLLNNPDSGLCQQQLHTKLSAPRFPMEFKLIILFKTWSFVIFYSFEAPYIMVAILITFIFLLINDKKNLYQHYRMEVIDYKVQRQFLSIYTTFFIAYMCFIFIFTQNLTIELPLTMGLSGVAIILQIIFNVRDRQDKHLNLDVTLDQIDYGKSYGEIYQTYLKGLRNPELDSLIEDYAKQLNSKKSLAENADSVTERLIA